MATKTANVSSDSWYALVSAENWGNGTGVQLAVGYISSGFPSPWQNRFAIKIPRGTLFDGVPSSGSITAFQMKLRCRSDCVGIGGTVKFYLERATTAMGENSEGRDCIMSTVGTVGVSRYPGPTRTTTNRALYQGSPAAGDWITVDCLALGQWWYSNPTVTELVLVAVASDGIGGYDELTAARRCIFYSRHTSSIPYVSMTYNADQAPNAPTNLAPADNATAPSTTATTATVSATMTHPTGSSSTQYEAAVYATTATDAAPGSPLTDNVVTATTLNNATRSHTFTGLTARTARKWRMRFGRNGLWGAWSLLRTITPVFQLDTPAQPYATPNTLAPDFFASIVSADAGDFITQAEVNVYQDPSQGQTITKWASGQVVIGGSPTRLQLAYGGTALAFDTQYRWVVRLANRDGIWSAWTANQYLTPLAQVGPNISPGDTSTKQNSKTPTFTLTRPGGGNFDQYRMRWYNALGTLLSDSGVVTVASTTTTNVVTPANLWDWGQQPMVDAAIRNTGDANIGPYSEKRTVRINAMPGTPYPLSVITAGAVKRADAVWVVDSVTPVVRFPFRDTDKDLGYVDVATRREVEVRTLADAHFGASPYIITTGITDDFTAPTLTAETTYKMRARYDDNAAVRGAFGEYIFVKRSAVPTLTNVTPANAATVTDPTPTIAWTYASAGGKAQGTYRVTATVAGNVVYDSGWVAGTAANHTLPAGLLANAVTVSWTLDVTDSDGLAAVQIARTFTTSFTQPPAITGLTLTPDDEQKAVLVAWTASTLPANEFLQYIVRARYGVRQFEDVAVITTQATVAYTYRGAPHNQAVIVQVVQDNGYMESLPAEATTQLDAEGTWRLDGGTPIRLRYVHPNSQQHQPIVEQAEYEPLAGTDAMVVTVAAYGVGGGLQLSVPPEDASVVDMLKEDYRLGRIVLLKTGKALAAYVKWRQVQVSDAEAGWTNVTLAYTEVGATSAGF